METFEFKPALLSSEIGLVSLFFSMTEWLGKFKRRKNYRRKKKNNRLKK